MLGYLGIGAVVLILFSISKTSEIHIPYSTPLTVRISRTNESDYYLMNKEEITQLLNIINHRKYKEFRGYANQQAGECVYVHSDFDVKRTGNTIDNSDYNVPISITFVEEYESYSSIQFRDIKRNKLMDYKLETEQLDSLKQFLNFK